MAQAATEAKPNVVRSYTKEVSGWNFLLFLVLSAGVGYEHRSFTAGLVTFAACVFLIHIQDILGALEEYLERKD